MVRTLLVVAALAVVLSGCAFGFCPAHPYFDIHHCTTGYRMNI